MRKDELLAAIRTDRAALDALVSGIAPAGLSEPRDAAGWRVQDHLAHIAAWERVLVAHLDTRAGHTVAGLDYPAFVTMGLEELNARLHDMHRDERVETTLEEYREAHGAVVEYVEAMPESRYGEPFWGDDPPPQKTVLEKVAGDTYLHYREHAAWIGDIVRLGAMR